MTNANSTICTIPVSWEAVSSAMACGNLRQADRAFMRHFDALRSDLTALSEYGLFCLRTRRPAIARYLLHRAHILAPADLETQCHLGYAHLELREVEPARRHFNEVIVRSPDHAGAHRGLAFCLLARSEFAAAVVAFDRARPNTPADACLSLLVNMAQACHRCGEEARARSLFSNAQRLEANNPALMLAIATFLRETGQPSQSLTVIDQCLHEDPGEARLLLEKARCLRLLGEPQQAILCLNRLGQFAPALPEAAEEMGNCLLSLDQVTHAHAHWLMAASGWIQSGDLGSARSVIDRLLAADCRHAAAWNARGTLEAAHEHYELAETAWRQALACDPKMIAAAANLVLHLEKVNRLDDARSVINGVAAELNSRASAIDDAALLLAMARVARRENSAAEALGHINAATAMPHSRANHAAIEFERGKVLHMLDRRTEAMAAFTRGNDEVARAWSTIHPGPNPVIPGLEELLGRARHGWWGNLRPIRNLPKHPPIAFLIGFPRSGTTLLTQVLGGHPSIVTMDELPPMVKVAEAMRNIPGGYPEALTDLDSIDVEWLREIYFSEAAKHVHLQSDQLLLDKFPMGTVRAGMLQTIFPHARFIFVRRHPCDVVLSCFMQHFQMNETMVNFCTLAGTVAAYTRVMDLWQLLQEQLSIHVHTISYEKVVDDFEGQVAQLCNFLQLSWHDALREFSTRARARGRIKTPSYEQVVRPIYGDSRNRWEGYREFLEPYLPMLRPFIERFGYASSSQENAI